MTVTIVGTLEMIYGSGGDTVSEAVHVDFASPTDAPLPLHESLVFPDRTPPVDIRVPLEFHLQEEHELIVFSRVSSPRAGALAEWVVTRDDIIRTLVLWDAVPLVQEGVDWGVTAVSDVGALWAYQSIPIGDGAEATGEASIAIGYNAKSTDESSTAMGHDASATGKGSLAVGRDANSSGENSIAIGVGSDASGMDSAAVGNGATAESHRSTAVGTGATAPADSGSAFGRLASAGGINSLALGFSSSSPGDGSVAIAGSATGEGGISVKGHAGADMSIALGFFARVQEGSDRSIVIGTGEVPANTPDSTYIVAKNLRVSPSGNASTLASTITLYDASGNPHVIRATVGQTHSHSSNASPGGENLTGVGTYSTAGVLRSGTLQSLIPEITTGLWDVDIEAHALVYRSVATGGVYLWVGNGTESYQQALGRLSPQTHAYTLNVYVSPTEGLTNLTPTSVLDLRYTGFSTAGTTNVVSHGWKITARRVG